MPSVRPFGSGLVLSTRRNCHAHPLTWDQVLREFRTANQTLLPVGKLDELMYIVVFGNWNFIGPMEPS